MRETDLPKLEFPDIGFVPYEDTPLERERFELFGGLDQLKQVTAEQIRTMPLSELIPLVEPARNCLNVPQEWIAQAKGISGNEAQEIELTAKAIAERVEEAANQLKELQEKIQGGKPSMIPAGEVEETLKPYLEAAELIAQESHDTTPEVERMKTFAQEVLGEYRTMDRLAKPEKK